MRCSGTEPLSLLRASCSGDNTWRSSFALPVGMDHTLTAAPDVIHRATVTCPTGFMDTQQANIGSNSPRFSSHLKPRACQPPLFTVISENKRYTCTWQSSLEWMKHPLCSLLGAKPWCFLPSLLLLNLTLNQSLHPSDWVSHHNLVTLYLEIQVRPSTIAAPFWPPNSYHLPPGLPG